MNNRLLQTISIQQLLSENISFYVVADAVAVFASRIIGVPFFPIFSVLIVLAVFSVMDAAVLYQDHKRRKL